MTVKRGVTVTVLVVLTLAGCVVDPTGEREDPSGEREGRPTSECKRSGFLENGPYTEENARRGPPFAYMRHTFCTHEDRDQVSYTFEMSDARKQVHAVFTITFSSFMRTGEGASARYRHTTFRAISDFAEQNALSKWLTCRDGIRSRQEFRADNCYEVDHADTRRIAPGEPGGQAGAAFPCGINVGPDRVRDDPGDEVSRLVYGGERGHLTGWQEGEEIDLVMDDRMEGIYLPAGFLPNIRFSTGLSECNAGP